jgi:hypothetical protein
VIQIWHPENKERSTNTSFHLQGNTHLKKQLASNFPILSLDDDVRVIEKFAVANTTDNAACKTHIPVLMTSTLGWLLSCVDQSALLLLAKQCL